MRIIFALAALATCFFTAAAQTNDDAVKARPFSGAEVSLKPSWIKQREDLNLQYLKSLNPNRLLHNFRVNAGLPSDAEPLEGWEAPYIGLRGHFTGHYLSALSRVVERHGDPQLASRLDYMVDELQKCQQALGGYYLSAFPEGDFDTLEATASGVWAPYYTYHKIMQGLLDAYERAGNRKALDMATGMAEYIGRRMAALDEATIEKMLYTAGANPPNEAGAMNEVLYRLYGITGNPSHFELAKVFDRDWFLIPLSQNRDILSGLHSNTHLVLVNGFAENYRLTHDTAHRAAAENFWHMLTDAHTYANGSSSGPRPNAVTPTSVTAEHWGKPGVLSNTMTKEIAESCVTHNTQKLTSALFSWTAGAEYADAYMNTLYNAVLALQSGHSGACVYHLPLGSPRTKAFLKDNDFRCCNGTSIEAFASLNSGIFYHNDSTLWVNLYIPSALNWGEKHIRVEQSGEFPIERSVELVVSAARPERMILNLFIPSWAEGTRVRVNGEDLQTAAMPGSYVSIDRYWGPGDRITLDFNYDFHLCSMPDDDNVVAIFHGPTLLAFESGSELILEGTHRDILDGLEATGGGTPTYSLRNGGRIYKLVPLYNIENESYGVYATLRN
ncbi:MAG: glycoside hydrolase family 127 protein [Muribaculaceae bacterium]|nr:glycoside hydrolase family 127 protein [Muribaculaceae bacterium]